MIEVLFEDELKTTLPNFSHVEKIVINTFRFKNTLEYEVYLIFVSDEYLSNLKNKFFKKNHFTDVIAFRLNDYENSLVEGEIYISLSRAKENAKEFKEHYAKEVSRLIIHGCLHLIGFSDKTRKEKKIMTNTENNILDKSNWKDLFKN